MDFNLETIVNKRRILSILVVVITLLAIGAFLCWWEADNADQRMRRDLLENAIQIRQAINIDRVLALSGTEDDLKRPEYLRLKEQFTIIRRNMADTRFIYLMGRRPDGKIFIYFDSEPADSKDYSPPGQVYEEATPDDRNVFDNGHAAVFGPVTDRWGTWVSARVPVNVSKNDHGPGKIIAVLGIDIDAHTWNQKTVWPMLPFLLFTLVLLSIAVTFLYFYPNRSLSNNIRSYQIETLAGIGVCLSLTFIAAWSLNEKESEHRINMFHNLSANKATALRENLRDLRDIELGGLASFFKSDEYVTYEEFQTYTKHLLTQTNVQAWEWIPVVPEANKSRFEQDARAAGMAQFKIWQKDAHGASIPAEGRELYYPVFYVSPLVGNERALGYDLGSEPTSRIAIKKAIQSGLLTATKPITLVQAAEEQKRPCLSCNPYLALEAQSN
jgi:hypothetical protein